MLHSNTGFVRWLQLLDEEIEREVRLYHERLAAGTATDAWHAQIASQCASWRRELTAALAHPRWPEFCSRNPGITADTVHTILTDIITIEAALGTPQAEATIRGCLE